MSQYSRGLSTEMARVRVSETVRAREASVYFTRSLQHIFFFLSHLITAEKKKGVDTVIYGTLLSVPNNKQAVNQLCSTVN